MATQDRSVYIDKTSGSEKMYQVFNSNRMGIVPTGPWELPQIMEAKADYGVVAMPTFNGKPVTIAGPDTWMLFNNGDDRPRAAGRAVLSEDLRGARAVDHRCAARPGVAGRRARQGGQGRQQGARRLRPR